MEGMVLRRPRWLVWAFGALFLLALMALGATDARAQGQPELQYVSHEIIYDSINHDGVANPGEFVYLLVRIRNTGTVTAYNVSGSLQTGNWEATCYGVGNYGNVGPDEEKSQQSGDLYFHLSPLTPDGRVIEFTLDLFDGSGTYYSLGPFQVPVVDNIGPYLSDKSVAPKITTPSSPVTLTATLLDGSGVDLVTATVRSSDNSIVTQIPMYDDGLHGDGEAGDGNYGAVWTTPSVAHDFIAGFAAVDGLGYVAEYPDQLGFTTRSFSRHANILLVVDDVNEPGLDTYYTNALAANNFAYDLWYTFYRGSVPDSVILNYVPCIVIWAVPERGMLNDPENPSARSTLINYLDQGGKLFVTGQDVGYYIHDHPFYTNYLHAQFVQDNVDMFAVRGIPGDEIGDGLAFTIAGIGSGAGNQQWPSEINPIAPAQRVFEYYTVGGAAAQRKRVGGERVGHEAVLRGKAPSQSGVEPQGIVGSGTAGICVDTGTYKAVYFAFGFEGIDDEADRNAVMRAVVSWLHGHSNFEKSLAEGWNLVSLPVIPESEAITEVLSSIAGKYTLVEAYDAEHRMWRIYDPALPPEANTLLTLDEGTAFWIKMSEAATLQVPGLLPIYTEQTLFAGWNLVSYPASEPRAVGDALSSISGKYTQVLRYEPGESTVWKRYNVNIPPWANSLTQITSGWGYWVYVTQDCTLSIVN